MTYTVRIRHRGNVGYVFYEFPAWAFAYERLSSLWGMFTPDIDTCELKTTDGRWSPIPKPEG